jgi:hypothetical protein
MAIQVFDARTVRGVVFSYTIYDLKGTGKVPVKLAANEMHLITHDVVFSEGAARCRHLEVQRLAAGN